MEVPCFVSGKQPENAPENSRSSYPTPSVVATPPPSLQTTYELRLDTTGRQSDGYVQDTLPPMIDGYLAMGRDRSRSSLPSRQLFI